MRGIQIRSKKFYCYFLEVVFEHEHHFQIINQTKNGILYINWQHLHNKTKNGKREKQG